MSSGYKFNNTDLDDIFKLKKTKAKSAGLSGFIDTNGEDLSARYEASRAAGDLYLNATGYTLKGVDLNTMYMKSSAEIIPSFVITSDKARINETDNKTVTFTITTLDVDAGTTIAWQILYNGTKAPIQPGVFQDPSNGVVTLTTVQTNECSASFSVTAVGAPTYVGNTSFIAEITIPRDIPKYSGVVELLDNIWPTPIYELTSNKTQVRLGETVIFTASVKYAIQGETLQIKLDTLEMFSMPKNYYVSDSWYHSFEFSATVTEGSQYASYLEERGRSFRAILTRAGGVLASSPRMTVINL